MKQIQPLFFRDHSVLYHSLWDHQFQTFTHFPFCYHKLTITTRIHKDCSENFACRVMSKLAPSLGDKRAAVLYKL